MLIRDYKERRLVIIRSVFQPPYFCLCFSGANITVAQQPIVEESGIQSSQSLRYQKTVIVNSRPIYPIPPKPRLLSNPLRKAYRRVEVQ